MPTKLLLGVASALIPSLAEAQSMSPMRGEINSFTDKFAVRVYPANPYKHRIKVQIKVYDQDFQPISSARVSPSEFMLGANGKRSVLVVVPFDGEGERKVRVCTESVPYENENSNIKAQICGKFLGQRRL
ncbi:MAG: hypothetical protein WBA44_03735 [Mesorhizobium sp.]